MNRGDGFHELQEALHDHALEELDVAAVILGECGDGAPARGEEVLEVLLALVEELEPGFVRKVGLCTVRRRRCLSNGGYGGGAYIFWATSAPFSFFSYCASMACCSDLTSFAYRRVDVGYASNQEGQAVNRGPRHRLGRA